MRGRGPVEILVWLVVIVVIFIILLKLIEKL